MKFVFDPFRALGVLVCLDVQGNDYLAKPVQTPSYTPAKPSMSIQVGYAQVVISLLC